MKHFCTLLLSCLPLILIAQDYQLVRSDFVHFFTNDNQRHHGVKIDSISIEGNDSVFFNYWHVRTFNNGSWMVPYAPSFIGRKIVVRPDGVNLCFNLQGDTIRIKSLAEINESWNLMTMDSSSYIQGTISEIQNMMVLDSVVEVKTISLQAYDSSGNPLVHAVNGETFQISKTLGVIRSPDLYFFPENIQYYTLDGMEKPNRGIFRPACGQSYENVIGDESHWKYNWWTQSGQSYSYRSISKVVGIDNSWPFQTVYRHIIKQSYSNGGSPTTSAWNDTVVVDLSQPPAPCSGPMPNESDLLLKTLSGKMLYDSVIFAINPCGRPYHHRHHNLEYRYRADTTQGPNWYVGSLDSGGPISEDTTITYGLGLTYRKSYVWYPNNGSKLTLVYYKRDTEECGVPFSEGELLSLDEIQVPISWAHPNPVRHGSPIFFSAEFIALEILDLSGRLILKEDGSRNRFDTSVLTTGTYLLRFRTTSHISTQKLVVTD